MSGVKLSANGIDHFSERIQMAIEGTLNHRLANISEIRKVVTFLVGAGATVVAGDVVFVDAGFHIMV
jgi:enoyl-[acyl-carrier-protein] reductase (NADH)